ncbi:RcpC/CpaB family pilus assembly protein [uncultured Friedmanniella sp.]|uniref:RcpC/CpaB family pilus assembly protein n=1 Tax=uncultured Friedmanniella sp. TaxID=335381 RepID=UPI0035CAA13D
MSWHRRPLAAVAAALAVLTSVSAALPEGPATTTVVVAAEELQGGKVLSPADVAVHQIAADDAPTRAVADPGLLLGRTLAAPVAAGQVLTDLALVSARTTTAAGQVVAPVRLADAGLAGLLHPGDLVDVIAADGQGTKARVVARAVRVVTVPVVDETTSTEASGALVLVQVSAEVAPDLAQAASTGTLTVSWR